MGQNANDIFIAASPVYLGWEGPRLGVKLPNPLSFIPATPRLNNHPNLADGLTANLGYARSRGGIRGQRRKRSHAARGRSTGRNQPLQDRRVHRLDQMMVETCL